MSELFSGKKDCNQGSVPIKIILKHKIPIPYPLKIKKKNPPCPLDRFSKYGKYRKSTDPNPSVINGVNKEAVFVRKPYRP